MRLRSPAILLLLLMGILAGPVMRKFFPDSSLAIDPDHLLKDLLNPIVGLSVGMILYEGGLTLRVRELRTGAKVITMLVTCCWRWMACPLRPRCRWGTWWS